MMSRQTSSEPIQRPPVVCPICGKRYENPGPLAVCNGEPLGSHPTTEMVPIQSESKTTLGATPREARVVDWFRHPTGLPVDPAIIPSEAWWSAQDVVEQTGLYANRRQCRAELNRLRERGVLLRMGSRYRYRPSSWTGVQFT